MTKLEELNTQDSCLNRALPEEEVFVLLGRDISTPATIRFWADHRVKTGKNTFDDPQIMKALEDAERVENKYVALRQKIG